MYIAITRKKTAIQKRMAYTMEEIPVGTTEYDRVMYGGKEIKGVKMEMRGNEVWGKIKNEPWKLVGVIETEYTSPREYFKYEVADQIKPASQMFWRHYWNRKVNPDYKIKPSRNGPITREKIYE